MPRVLDPILQAGLDNNSGSAIIRVHLARSDAATFTSNEVLYCKLSNLEVEIKLAPFEFSIAPDTTYIQVERGLLINGVEYTVNSSWYIVRTIKIDYYGITLEAHLFSQDNISTPGDVAVNTVLAAFIAQTDVPHHTNSVAYLADAEWWKTIQFLPDGVTFALTLADNILAILKKKYLVSLFDIGENKVLPIGASMLTEFPATDPDHELDYTKCPTFSYSTPKPSNRQYLWQDELKRSHYSGPFNFPHHNLGYIESTVTPILTDLSNNAFSALLSPPRLDICNGDYVKITVPFYAVTEMQSRVFVDEIFDPNAKRTWRMELKAVEWIGTAEGYISPVPVIPIIVIREWLSRTSAADNQWYGIAWSPELNLFAAVAATGTGNRVMTSPDGINWTVRTSPADNTWTDIAWSPELGLFAAVAYWGTIPNNRVMTSPDGINWTIRASAADINWQAIAWSPELGLFAAVSSSGTGNRVMTSPDGINWTIRASAADNQWYGIAWSPEENLFAAVAATGTGNRVMTSPDGINWTIQTSAADYLWIDIAWSPELRLFAAVANSTTGNQIMTSPDGINWTIRTIEAGIAWLAIAWSPELSLFAAVGDIGAASRVITSPNGIDWTIRASSPINSWRDICWSPQLCLFAAVANSGTGDRVMTSL